jgi:hypothetical protein
MVEKPLSTDMFSMKLIVLKKAATNPDAACYPNISSQVLFFKDSLDFSSVPSLKVFKLSSFPETLSSISKESFKKGGNLKQIPAECFITAKAS